jgi:hypothetical protein
MDARIVLAAVVGLVLVAIGGFYFALRQPAYDWVPPPAQTAAASRQAGPATPAAPAGQPPASKPATPESIEAEIAKSDHADLQVLLKRHFPEDYRQLIDIAVRKRNEGAPDEALGEEVFNRFQQIMSAKLKFAVGASMQMIDKLAANEINLFNALGNEGSGFCLKVLGKDNSPSATVMPDRIRRLMRLGTLYRFEAIVDGMPRFQPAEPLTQTEIAAFEVSLGRDSMKFDEVRSGAFLSKEGEAPGKPCQMVEKLYRSIARLDEGTRRKLYAGMFFLGRDQ